MHKISLVAALAATALVLSACGGSPTGEDNLPAGGGGGGGGVGVTTYSLGNGSGASFQAGMIDVAVPSLSAGGTTGLQVSIVDKNGVLYTGGAVTVSFNSPCAAAGQATIAATGSGAGATPGSVSTST